MVNDGWFTTRLPVALLPWNPPCVAYAARRVWVPAFGATMVNVEEPEARAWLIGVPPSTVNVRLPVGVNPVGLDVTLTVTTPSAL
jgi:hypothetical protein